MSDEQYILDASILVNYRTRAEQEMQIVSEVRSSFELYLVAELLFTAEGREQVVEKMITMPFDEHVEKVIHCVGDTVFGLETLDQLLQYCYEYDYFLTELGGGILIFLEDITHIYEKKDNTELFQMLKNYIDIYEPIFLRYLKDMIMYKTVSEDFLREVANDPVVPEHIQKTALAHKCYPNTKI